MITIDLCVDQYSRFQFIFMSGRSSQERAQLRFNEMHSSFNHVLLLPKSKKETDDLTHPIPLPVENKKDLAFDTKNCTPYIHSESETQSRDTESDHAYGVETSERAVSRMAWHGLRKAVMTGEPRYACADPLMGCWGRRWVVAFCSFFFHFIFVLLFFLFFL